MVVYLSLPQLTLHQKLTFHYLLTTRQQARFLHGRSREPGDVWNGYWGEEGPEEREASEGGRHAPQPLNRPRAATGPRPPGGRREGVPCDRFHVSRQPGPASRAAPTHAGLGLAVSTPAARTTPALEAHPRGPYQKLWSPFSRTERTASQQLPRADPSFPPADRKTG